MSSALQRLASDTVKGLLSAPLPACSCAKGLAVGVELGWSSLQEAVGSVFETNSAKPNQPRTCEAQRVQHVAKKFAGDIEVNSSSMHGPSEPPELLDHHEHPAWCDPLCGAMLSWLLSIALLDF